MILKGEIYNANLDPVLGSEQKGTRPVLIIQNNIGNYYSPTVIVTMISSNTNKKRLPTHVTIRKEDSGLPEDSVIMLEQIRTIDKRRLSERMGAIGEKELLLIDEAVKCSLAIT